MRFILKTTTLVDGKETARYYVVETYFYGGKPRERMLAALGEFSTVEAARKNLQAEFAEYTRLAAEIKAEADRIAKAQGGVTPVRIKLSDWHHPRKWITDYALYIRKARVTKKKIGWLEGL